jgi:hypothetical protein
MSMAIATPLAAIASYSSFHDDDEDDNTSTYSVVDELNKEMQKLSRDADRILDSIRNEVSASSITSSNRKKECNSPPLCTETTSEEDFDENDNINARVLKKYNAFHNGEYFSDDEYYNSDDDVDYELDKLQESLLQVDDFSAINAAAMSPVLVRRRKKQIVHDDKQIGVSSLHASSHSLRSSVHSSRRSLQSSSLHRSRSTHNKSNTKSSKPIVVTNAVHPVRTAQQCITETLTTKTDSNTGTIQSIFRNSIVNGTNTVTHKIEHILYQYLVKFYQLEGVDNEKYDQLSETVELILIIAVILVWGTIFYLVVRALYLY